MGENAHAESNFTRRTPPAPRLAFRVDWITYMVELYLQFRSRKPGTFGNSLVGQALEIVTATWLRFTCLLMSIGIIAIALSSNLPFDQKLLMVVFSPIAAIFYWYVFLFLLLISRYLGKFGTVLAHVLIIYFYVFSRCVVQSPPGVYLPLTRGGPRI